MRKSFTRAILLLFASSFVLFSCSKEEDVEPIIPTITASDEFTSESYYPLNIGNEWTYTGPVLNYTLTVTGKEVVGNAEYNNIYNSQYDATTQIRYKDGKYYSIGQITNPGVIGGIQEFLILDERASVGDTWKMGQIDQENQGIMVSTVYDIFVTGTHSTKTINNEEYSDVFELLTTTTSTYSFSQELIDQFGGSLTPEDFGLADIPVIKQTTFYAKGVGLVSQNSDDVASLELNLESYKLVD